MKFIPYILLWSALSQASAQSDTTATLVRSINFYGNQRLSAAKLIGVIASKVGEPLIHDLVIADTRNVLELYRRQNLWLAVVDSISMDSSGSSGVDLVFHITENRALILESIELTGMSAISSARLQRELTNANGRPFDPDRLSDDIEQILRLYENSGYPMARVACDSVVFLPRDHETRLRLRLRITENQTVTVGRVEFAGLTQTRSSVLLREMRTALPSPYNQSAMDASVDRLRRLPFIDRVDEPELMRHGDSSYTLRLTVAEGQPNTIDGIVGYVPARPRTDEKGYFTGLMNLSFQNLFGTARRLDAKWHKKDRYSQEFRLAYAEPWVMDYPVNLGVSMQQLVQDTIYVDRELALDGSVWLGSTWMGLFGVRNKTIDPAGSANGFLYNIPSASFLSGYLGMAYDIRDDRINPRRGVLYRVSVEYGRKSESYFVEDPAGTDTISFRGVPVPVREIHDRVATQKWLMDFEWMAEWRRNVVFYNLTHAAFYKTPQTVVPYSEQFRFGGLQSVRGYVEDFFNGTRVGWNRTEGRWLTGRRSRLFIFFDVGYYYRKDYADAGRTTTVRRDGWPMGYGFGLRYQTRLGLFGLDYGLGRGDAFSSGKVHFGITSQF